jgi:hypothetical protein
MTIANQNETLQKKLMFYLEPDEDGYPPFNWESLWVYQINPERFQIDNIPFFVRDISYKDVVSVQRKEGELHFEELVIPSAHSTIRVIVFNEKHVESLRQSLTRLGCSSELNKTKLISVDIPPEVNYSKVIELLAKGEEDELWGYEEAAIRHNIINQ